MTQQKIVNQIEKIKEENEKIKIINLTQYNLNQLETGTKFIYIKDNHYKKGLIVNNATQKIMIPLSTICDIKNGIEEAKRLFNY